MTFRIETERLVVLPFAAEDLDFSLRFQADSAIMRHIGDGARTPDQIRARHGQFIRHAARHGFSLGKVIVKETGSIAGQAGLIHLGFDDDNPEIEVAYAFLPEMWGKGYATEVARACVDWGFANLDVPRLVGLLVEENAASKAVLMKVGMKPDPTVPQYSRYGIGMAIYRNQNQEARA